MNNGLQNGLHDGLYNGLDNGLFNGLYGELGYFDSDFLNFYKRKVIPFTDIEKWAYNEFFVKIKQKYAVKRLSDLADALYLYRGNKTDCLLNLVKPSHTATIFGNLAHSATLGIGSLGGYLDLNYNPFRQGIKFTLNDASFGYYNQSESNNATRNIGAEISPHQITSIPHESGLFFYAINGGLLNVANSSSKGHFYVSRKSSTVTVYKNGSILTTVTNAATGVPDSNLAACSRYYNGVIQGKKSDTLSCLYFARGEFNIHTELQELATILKFNT